MFKSPPLTRRIATGLVFGFVVFLALAILGDLRKVSQQISTFRWSLYPLVLLLSLVNYSMRFIKWHYYVGQVGAKDLPVTLSARLFFSSFPLSVTPGKIGEALKGVWLNQLSSLPVARGIAVVLAERISDGFAVMALSTIGVIAYPRYWPAFAVLISILLSIIIVSQIRPLALSLLKLGERLPLVHRFAFSLHEFYEGSYILFHPATTLIAVGLGIASWVWEGVGLYLILLGLGVPPEQHMLSIAIFVLAFSTIIGAISTLPGGLGASDASIAGMLVLLLGLEADVSAAATLLARLATLWFGVSLGFVVWFFSRDLLGIKETLRMHTSNVD